VVIQLFPIAALLAPTQQTQHHLPSQPNIPFKTFSLTTEVTFLLFLLPGHSLFWVEFEIR
jgi:hypothetical protein